MKAIYLDDYGSADNFRIGEALKPEPGPGEVLVKIEYAGLRWGDIMARNGIPAKRLTPPFIPGQEGAGVIEKLGANVTGLKVGMHVIGTPYQDMYAEYAAIPVDRITVIPDGVPLDKMLIYVINMRVAYMIGYVWGKVQPNETVMIHSAAGGVGLLTIEMLKRRFENVRVIALTSSDEKTEVCLAHGADIAINYKTTNYVDEVNRLIGPNKVDLVLNGVGGETLNQDYKVIRPRGRWIVYGAVGGPLVFDTRPYVYNSITIMPFSILAWAGTPELVAANAFVADWVTKEKLMTPTVYPIEQIAAAQRLMEQGKTYGKVVFKV